MLKTIKIIKKNIFGNEQYIGDIRNPDEFIIPAIGSMFKLDGDQIGKWGGQETTTIWKVRCVKYEYTKQYKFERKISECLTTNICNITVYVR